ncbi:MAG: hypothetical protein LUD16_10730 [Lachnospiraceae bacterium]|nr:hypothetical protein [Lachnospiraceae bacterium]
MRFIRNKEEFQALELCNGKIDCDGALIPQKLREIIHTAKEEGLVVPCEYGDGISKDQEYRRYDNRFIQTTHWSITGKCNYRCRHCYMSAPRAGTTGFAASKVRVMRYCGPLTCAMSMDSRPDPKCVCTRATGTFCGRAF